MPYVYSSDAPSVDRAHVYSSHRRRRTPSQSQDRLQETTSSAYRDFQHQEECMDKRIAEEKHWLSKMKRKLRQVWKRERSEQESATLLCSVLRASSALLTEEATHTESAFPFRCALDSFLDGTPFMTTQSLCRYNVAIAESLSDKHLELLRHHVFDYDETAFAELLYADDVDMSPKDDAPGAVPEAVAHFNGQSRKALERLFAAPDGLADAVVRAASAVPIAHDEDEVERGEYEHLDT